MKYLIKLLTLTSIIFLPITGYTLEANKTIEFAVIGDYGNGSSHEKDVANLIDEKNPDFILTLGDNNYPQGCWNTIDTHIGEYYHKYIGHYKGKFGKGAADNKFFPALGNHDWAAMEECPRSNELLAYSEYFTLPGNGRYYDFVKGSVHFFALDSDVREPDGNVIGSKQYLWLVDKLRASESKFNIVYFHHAPYSSGDHGDSEFMQWNFSSIGADVVMSGHDHDYERIEKNGIVYLVNGAGGAHLYSKEHSAEDSVFFYNKHHGFLWVEANNHQMTIKFINTKNQIIDTRVVNK